MTADQFRSWATTHVGTRLFPEILRDSRNAKSRLWQKSQWWLHV